jgi:hypothetical protein
VPWEAALAPDVLELTEKELLPPVAEAPVEEQNGVVRLFPLPTPGDLHRRIDRHLEQRQPVEARRAPADVVPLGADATDALRSALQELRRSLA